MKRRNVFISVFVIFLFETQMILAKEKKTEKKEAPIKYEKVNVSYDTKGLLRLEAEPQAFFTADDLKDQNTFHLENLTLFTANMTAAGGSNRARFFQIRGIGERSEYDSVPSYSVGLFYDHIDFSGAGGVLSTYDTSQVEVLKGPQSYLYGDSALGGNLVMLSSEPTNEKTEVTIETGSQKRRRLGFRKNMVLNDNLSFKVGAEVFKSDGFYHNLYLDQTTSNQDEFSAHAGLNFDDKNFILKTRHLYVDFNNGYDVWNAYNNNFTTLTDRPGRDFQRSQGHSLELTLPLPKKQNLTVIASYSEHDILYSYDEDWGNNDFWLSLPGFENSYDYSKSYDRIKQNVHSKVIYQFGFKNSLWSFGAHHYTRNENALIKSYKEGLLRDTLKSKMRSKNSALFSSLNQRISKDWQVFLGGRLELQELEYADNSFPFENLKSKMVSFEVGTKRSLGENNSIYAKLSRGFKGAGLNPDINLSDEQKFYEPESLLNYEVQWKAKFWGHEQSITIFYMDRQNQQISASTQENPLDPSDFTVFVDNAAKTSHRGVEWSSHFRISETLSSQFSFGHMATRFEDYTFKGKNLTGRSLPYSPEWNHSVMLKYSPSSKAHMSVNLSGQSSFYFSNSHNGRSSSYSFLGANLSYKTTDKTKISLWARNILSKKFSNRGFFFPNRPPNWIEELYVQNGPPLEWGINFSKNL